MSFGYGRGYDITGDDGYGSGYEITGDDTVNLNNGVDGWISDRTSADEGTLYIWGDHGSEFACSDTRFAVTDEGERRIAIYCQARAHAFPDVFAAHAAGIVLSTPPQSESFPGQHAFNWLIDQANKVDFAFINTQLGIIGGQNVGDAIKRDWKNAVESGDIAQAIKDGDYDKAWATMRAKFHDSASAAGSEPPVVLVTVPNQSAAPGAKHIGLGALKTIGTLGGKPVDAHIANGVQLIVDAHDENPNVSGPAKQTITNLVAQAEQGNVSAAVAVNTLLQANPLAQFALIRGAARSGNRVQLKRYALAVLLEVQAESGAPINIGRYQQYMK